MAGPNARTDVPVEVFVEEDEVLPMRIGLKLLCPAIDRSMRVTITEKEVREATREITGDFP
jgi:hypothetical protein